jgi:hypothetical protein
LIRSASKKRATPTRRNEQDQRVRCLLRIVSAVLSTRCPSSDIAAVILTGVISHGVEDHEGPLLHSVQDRSQ